MLGKISDMFSVKKSFRWELIYLMASGLAVAYSLRVNMSVSAGKMAEEFGWSETQKGYILSSFFWGYTVGQIPFSIIGQIFGAKWVFGLCVFVPSVITLFVPIAAKTSFGTVLFVRVLIGFCASGSLPATYNFFRNWIPRDERTVMIPIVYAGTYLGSIVAFPVCGVLVEAHIEVFGGWQSCFYLFGLIGIVWFPFWAFLVHEHPEQHPKMLPEELTHINKGKRMLSIADLDELEAKQQANGIFTSSTRPPPTPAPVPVTDLESNVDTLVVKVAMDSTPEQVEEEVRRQRQGSNASQISVCFLSDDAHAVEITERTPWLAFFGSMAFITLLINNFVSSFITFMLLSELPSFLTLFLKFSSESAGILSMPPFVALMVSNILFGALFEHLQTHCGWKVHTVRQVAQTIALLGSSTSLVIVVFCNDVNTSYAFLIIAQFLYGAISSGVNCGYTDISPNFSFSMNSIGNDLGSVAGLLGPIIVAEFTTAYPGVWGWRGAFLVTAGISVIALLFWYAFSVSYVIHHLNVPTPKKVPSNINKLELLQQQEGQGGESPNNNDDDNAEEGSTEGVEMMPDEISNK